ncbi:MAG: GNAT family N-acetyltransferase [Lactobacillaceae bacterium]|jgi:ribosomal protein S18 acetylase RimI-like enzyme|nr:GNAT family N-acetyltransferase [Lactobacillaceae bacterium]
MKILELAEVSASQLQEIKKLESEVLKYDGTFRQAYLSTQYNFDRTMPAYFLAYQDDRLIGSLFLYADDPSDTTVYLFVKPEFRSQKVATDLISHAQKIIQEFSITDFSFSTEQHFLDENPWMMDKVVKGPDYELLMSRDNKPATAEDENLQIEVLNADNLDQVVELEHRNFPEHSKEINRRYLEANISDPSIVTFVLKLEDSIVGSTSIDIASDNNYFFSLSVDGNFRGRGFAPKMISMSINQIATMNSKPFQLSVDHDNLAAIKAYQKSGFEEVSKVVYLKLKD